MHVHYARNRTDVSSTLKTMDRWILIAAVFFFTTEVFSVVALGSPNWITSYDGGGKREYNTSCTPCTKNVTAANINVHGDTC